MGHDNSKQEYIYPDYKIKYNDSKNISKSLCEKVLVYKCKKSRSIYVIKYSGFTYKFKFNNKIEVSKNDYDLILDYKNNEYYYHPFSIIKKRNTYEIYFFQQYIF